MQVVVCTWDEGRDGLPSGFEQLLTLGARLSTAAGADLDWLVIGQISEQAKDAARRYGVTHIEQVEDPKLAGFQPDACVEALAQYGARQAPRVLLLNQTFDARLIAPRLAARTGAGVTMNAVDAEIGDNGTLRITTSAYGGDTRAVYELTGAESCVVGVMADSLEEQPPEAAPSGDPALRQVEVDLGSVEERVRVVEQATSQGARLEDAQIIVAGGRGLAERENFELIEQLAEALGGMAAASRPIVDDGWIDSSRQVGLTGKITRPALYIAAGISGASQHMAGCAAAKVLVAINTDEDAAIFRYANYGIVADCLEILPELTRNAKGK